MNHYYLSKEKWGIHDIEGNLNERALIINDRTSSQAVIDSLIISGFLSKGASVDTIEVVYDHNDLLLINMGTGKEIAILEWVSSAPESNLIIGLAEWKG